MENEEWRHVPNMNNVQASSFGRIWSKRVIKQWSVRKTNNRQLAYKMVTIGGLPYYVHRLIALAFIENIHNKPEINHKDFNVCNNRPENLEWVTSGENSKYSSWKRKGIKNGKSKFGENDVIQIKLMLHNGIMQKQIAEMYNVHRDTIMNIASGKTYKSIN